MNTAQTPTGGASLSDLLTAAKNIVLGLSTLATNYLNVEGQISYANITAPTVVKATGGRVARVSVTTAGSSAGVIYDSSSAAGATLPVASIPATVGIMPAGIPTSYGIFVVPGAGQALTVVYS